MYFWTGSVRRETILELTQSKNMLILRDTSPPPKKKNQNKTKTKKTELIQVIYNL
jgi:hypothetical protein